MGYEQLLYITFGWLLGLLAPAIVERIRKEHRRSELTVAIQAELHELQYKMAFCSHKLNSHLATVTDRHLAWLEQIVRHYTGPNPKAGVLNALAEYRKVTEEERRQALAMKRDPNVGVGLLQYSLPFLTAHLADASLFPVPFQSALIRIKDQLDMYNQNAEYLQKLHDKTFDASLTEQNRSIVVSNLERGYRDLADQAAFIADAIATLPA
jgi:hypothetical protein